MPSTPGPSSFTVAPQRGKPDTAPPPQIKSRPSTKSQPKTPQSSAVEPAKFWDSYFADPKRDESATDLFEMVTLLRQDQKFLDVEAVIWAYLKHRPKNSEPWMYEALALAMEINQRDSEKIKVAWSYATTLAARSQDPNDQLRVADMLLIRKDYPPVGKLLDQAMEKLPHRAEPAMMSIKLALETIDTDRFSDATERILSLGWPGADDQMRNLITNNAQLLARQLQAKHREDDAESLLSRLQTSLQRDVVVRLSWSGHADLDLAVEDPGGIASFKNPRTVFGGAILRNGYGKNSEELYSCPRAFDGKYTLRVSVIYDDPANPAKDVNLEIILYEGTSRETKLRKSVDLKSLTPIDFTVSGGRRQKALPYVAPPAARVVTAPLPKSDTSSRKNPSASRLGSGTNDPKPPIRP